jgi:hypothetical protein
MGDTTTWKEICKKYLCEVTCEAKIKLLNECTYLIHALCLDLEDLCMSGTDISTTITMITKALTCQLEAAKDGQTAACDM